MVIIALQILDVVTSIRPWCMRQLGVQVGADFAQEHWALGADLSPSAPLHSHTQKKKDGDTGKQWEWKEEM